jgi:pimeloyl-ACP methyl ester carboxylesterase
VRLHYVERGTGRPLVLFHGNGSMIQDFESSGLIDLAAKSYRVIVFDRPGFGHSSRPRNVVWTPEAQADLFANALERLNVRRAIALGQSWGASVGNKAPPTGRGPGACIRILFSDCPRRRLSAVTHLPYRDLAIS